MLGYYTKFPQPTITFEIIEDVAEEVLSLDEVRTGYVGVDFDDFDQLFVTLISAAREWAEKYTGLSIGKRVIKLKGDYLHPKAYLPFAPFGLIDDAGLQTVGYTKETVPAGLKLAIMNMVHIAFENRATGLNFNIAIRQLDLYRRRVCL